MHYKDYIATLPPYKPPKLIRQQPQGVVKLSSNENPLGPSPRALAAIREAAAGEQFTLTVTGIAASTTIDRRFGEPTTCLLYTSPSPRD